MIRRARIRGQEWAKYPLLCLSVSLGKDQHEGEDLRAALRFIASTGKPWILDLADTLQRHNLVAEGIAMQAAHDKTRRGGDAWIVRYEPDFAAMPFAPLIIRTDQMLKDPRFPPVRDAIMRAHDTDSCFRDAVAEDAKQFTGRALGRVKQSSYDFIFEECTVETLIGRDYQACRLYPSTELLALQYLRRHADRITPGYERMGYTRFSLESRHAEPVQNFLTA